MMIHFDDLLSREFRGPAIAGLFWGLFVPSARKAALHMAAFEAAWVAEQRKEWDSVDHPAWAGFFPWVDEAHCCARPATIAERRYFAAELAAEAKIVGGLAADDVKAAEAYVFV